MSKLFLTGNIEIMKTFYVTTLVFEFVYACWKPGLNGGIHLFRYTTHLRMCVVSIIIIYIINVLSYI